MKALGGGRVTSLSWYLTIRGAADYSLYTATAPLVEFLAAMPDLRQTTPVTFEAADERPWTAVMLGVSDSAGCYAAEGAFLPRVNVVELTCSNSADPSWYLELAGRIADFLAWSAFNDHEERQVWPPSEQTHAESGDSSARGPE